MVAKRRAIRAHERDLTLAWNIAAMTMAAKVNKLQPLETLLKQPGTQTVHDHHSALRVLSEQTGIAARYVKRSSLKLVRKVA